MPFKRIDVPESEFYENKSSMRRLLPFLTGDEELISRDEITYTTGTLFAKPDLVVKDSGTIYISEFKSCTYPNCPMDHVCTHALQVMTCAYAYSRSQKVVPTNIKLYLRFADCYLEIIDWHEYVDSIDLGVKLYLDATNEKKVAAKQLALFMALISPRIKLKPYDNAESSLKGQGLHALAMVDGELPSLYRPPKCMTFNS